MRPIVGLIALLVLAGCASPETGTETVTEAGDAPPLVLTKEVADSVLSPVSVCPPVGYCAGVFGSDEATFSGEVFVAFDVTFQPSEGHPTTPLADLAEVRFVAECLGERLTCPQEPLAVAGGDFPVRLQAQGFRIEDPNLLSFRVEYLGPLPVEGSGASYTLQGMLSYLESGDEAADVEDGEG